MMDVNCTCTKSEATENPDAMGQILGLRPAVLYVFKDSVGLSLLV